MNTFMEAILTRLQKHVCALINYARLLKREERGDLVSALGWMAITAVILVAISTVLSGGMTNLVESIFLKLEGLLI